MARILFVTAALASLALSTVAAADDPPAAPPPSDALPDVRSLWDFGDPAGTEAKFRELLPRAEASGDAGYLVTLLSQIGRAQGLQKKFDDAHATLDRAQGLLKDEMALPRARVLLERGRVRNSAGDPAKAKPLFLEALEVAKSAGEPGEGLAIDAAHMLGIIGETADAQIEWNEKALAMAEAAKDPKAKGWIGPLSHNLGWSYHERGIAAPTLDAAHRAFLRALELHERSLDVRLAEKATDGEEVTVGRWTVARSLRSLARHTDALAILERLDKEIAAAGKEDGYVFEEIGENLLALVVPDQAKPWFAKAHAALSKDADLVKSEPKRIERLKSLGGVP